MASHALSDTRYEAKKADLTTYFDSTAAAQWEALTSDAPVGRIRATVRAGRDRMRALLLSLLPDELTGTSLLDAGCGTGALAIEAAQRGAAVTAIDVSPRLIEVAHDRALKAGVANRIEYLAGDMLDPELGEFTHAIFMDSLIHYERDDIVAALARLAPRIERSILFTIAPRTRLLAAMHAAGQLFPRGNRSPALSPIAPDRLAQAIARTPQLGDWRQGHCERVASGFYASQMQELVRR
ncbi:magnesium protoporphyrin IX methyltransferase [Erythrobacter sp. LQ02-29]|uniref:magnesium protoporphyrin IX methyltransferase n=1 Tax=Erythrobacter sp. LQ02-29 TaxID=2920384 RepID=UPI001F4E40C6|nr:magnesium protoporphyrin IX methyltransferase [Erythrobacter sp. LQ02-29]MCP9223835.1 magnesium protoporphyrin IX methyltransferase [Erythrobacter sp. LQ02-29]